MDAAALLERRERERLWGDPDFLYERSYYAHRDLRRALYADGLAAGLESFDCTRRPFIDVDAMQGFHPFHRRAYIDFKVRLADHLLADHGDRMAYANSIEARYPFLDLEVIDCVAGIHPDLLVREGLEKALLRRVAKPYVPDSIIQREKFAFVAPGSPALLQRGIDWVEDLLDEERIRHDGYFDPGTVSLLKQRYREPGFTLNTTFEEDWLMMVLTFGLLREQFDLPRLEG
jgi:asparagine synthase (glutamine-hydrolysing)